MPEEKTRIIIDINKNNFMYKLDTLSNLEFLLRNTSSAHIDTFLKLLNDGAIKTYIYGDVVDRYIIGEPYFKYHKIELIGYGKKEDFKEMKELLSIKNANTRFKDIKNTLLYNNILFNIKRIETNPIPEDHEIIHYIIENENSSLNKPSSEEEEIATIDLLLMDDHTFARKMIAMESIGIKITDYNSGK